jgi:hypothetical protein
VQRARKAEKTEISRRNVLQYRDQVDFSEIVFWDGPDFVKIRRSAMRNSRYRDFDTSDGSNPPLLGRMAISSRMARRVFST